MAVTLNFLGANVTDTTVSLSAPIGTAGDAGVKITVGSEDMLVRSGLGTGGLVVERGVGGTTVAAHNVGSAVTLGLSGTVGVPTLDEVVTSGMDVLYSAGTAAPAAAFGSLLYADTTNKHLYVWNPAASNYVKVSDWS